MSRKLFVLLVLTLIALVSALPALAQEPGPFAGEYTYTGTFSDDEYNGEMVISGTSPFYTLSYFDTGGSGGITEENLDALALGNVLVTPLEVAEDDTCAPGILLRRTDGVLIGLWKDDFTETMAPLGIEYYIPQNATTDFGGTYTLYGTYANGQSYTATTTISIGDNDIYHLTFDYTLDELAPEEVPHTETGLGIASGSVLGYSPSDDESKCGVYLAKFDGMGNYNAVWFVEDGTTGTEAGSRK